MTVKENKDRLDRHEKTLEHLAAIVVGNGKRGMDEIVRKTEERVEANEQRGLCSISGKAHSFYYSIR